MTEGEVVEQLVNFTTILLTGVSLIFSVISAYIVALNYFIGQANFTARLGSFAFMTLILGMLVLVMMGGQTTQVGLVSRLHELSAEGHLSAAGRAVLANAERKTNLGNFSVDDVVRLCVYTGFGMVYLAMFYLTFAHRWRPDVVEVALADRKSR